MPDNLTLISVNALTGVFTTLVVAVLWRGVPAYPGMREIRSGLLLGTVYFIFQSLRAVLPLPLVVVVSLPAIMVSLGMAFSGASVLAGKKPFIGRLVPGAVLALIGVAYFLFVAPSAQVRTMVVDLWIAFAALNFVIAVAGQSGSAVRPGTRRLLLGLGAVHGLTEFGRCAMIVSRGLEIDLMAPSWPMSLVLIENNLFVIGFATVCLQIVSERREDDLKRAQAVLAAELARKHEHASMQRGFVAMANRHLRPPLSAVDGQAALIVQAADGRTAADRAIGDAAAEIRRTVARTLSLMDTVLGVAGANDGEAEPRITAVDLAMLIAEVIEAQRLAAPGRRFDLDVGNLPPTVECDRDLIEQAIINLLSNAVRYSPPGQPVCVTGHVEGGMAVIAVRDRGQGIPPDEQKRLFERSLSDGAPGAGLTIARHIVDLHGGMISLSSAADIGTTFTIRLPIRRAAILRREV